MKGLITDINGDLMIAGGYLAIDDNNNQTARRAILAQQGECKDFPIVGLGIHNYLKSNEIHVKTIFESKVIDEMYKLGFNNYELQINDLIDFELNIIE